MASFLSWGPSGPDCSGSMFSTSLPCRCYSILSHELPCARRGGVCVWPFLISPKILLRIFFQMRQIRASHSHMPRCGDSPLAKVCKSISHTKSMVEITELSKKLKGALCSLNTVAILCVAMSFYGLISKRAGEMACLLLPFLPHIAFYKTGDQLLKISKPRGGEMQAALLLKYVEQSKDSYHTTSHAQWVTLDPRTPDLLGLLLQAWLHLYCVQLTGPRLYALQCQCLLQKSSGARGTEQYVVNAQWQSLLSN